MSNEIRVIQYGLGPIGAATAHHIVKRTGLDLVGGVDIDPAKVGKDVSEVIGLGYPLGFAVTNNLAQILEKAEADVVTHTTSSYFDLFKKTKETSLVIAAIIKAKYKKLKKAAS